MEIKLVRKFKGPEYTIGDLFIDGAKICNTLEDTVRVLIDKNNDGDFDDPGEGKIYGETAIPAGRYEVVVTYSPRFKKYLPLLLKVPGFAGIRIHPGNTAKDTHGCILPGINKSKGSISESVKYFTLIFDKITKVLNVDKRKVFIEII
jgi:hypothetical protein